MNDRNLKTILFIGVLLLSYALKSQNDYENRLVLISAKFENYLINFPPVTTWQNDFDYQLYSLISDIETEISKIETEIIFENSFDSSIPSSLSLSELKIIKKNTEIIKHFIATISPNFDYKYYNDFIDYRSLQIVLNYINFEIEIINDSDFCIELIWLIIGGYKCYLAYNNSDNHYTVHFKYKGRKIDMGLPKNNIRKLFSNYEEGYIKIGDNYSFTCDKI